MCTDIPFLIQFLKYFNSIRPICLHVYQKFVEPICSLIVDMEEKIQLRSAIVAMHRQGKANGEIFKFFKSRNVTRNFVYRTVTRYRQTLSVKDRSRSGRPRSTRTKNFIKAVKARIRRNPVRSGRRLAEDMNTSHRTLHRTLTKDLKLRAFKKYKSHFLTVIWTP